METMCYPEGVTEPRAWRCGAAVSIPDQVWSGPRPRCRPAIEPATSRANEMKSSATGLSARSFRVTIPIGLPTAGMSTGRDLISFPPASLNTEAGSMVRKRPLASNALRAGIEVATNAARGTSSPLARNTSATNGHVRLSRDGSVQGSFNKSASFTRRRRHHGFCAPAATMNGSS
jgi:hypothetical protein